MFVFAPALFMLGAPYWLSAVNPLGSTIVQSAYYLVEAMLLLAILGFVARREATGIRTVIAYAKPVPRLVFLALALLGAGWAIYMRDFLVVPALQKFSMSAMRALPEWPSIFARLPQHDAVFDGLGDAGRALSLVTIAITVAAASVMQSLYFRGFLLSRLDHRGILAPAYITLLFVAFHLGSPFFWPQFLLLTATWAFIAYFTKNVWVVVVAHVIMNIYSPLLALGAMALGRH